MTERESFFARRTESTDGHVTAPRSITYRVIAADEKKTGRVWDIMVIKAGLSHNRSPEGYQFYYAPEMLKGIMPMYEGKPVYAFEFDESLLAKGEPSAQQHGHLPGNDPEAIRIKVAQGIAKNKVGQLAKIRWGTDNEGNEGIVAQLTLVDDTIAQRMAAAWDEGLKDFLGYSHDTFGPYDVQTVAGQKVAAVQVKYVDSVDLVSSPAAGGKNIRLAAAITNPEDIRPMNKKVLAAVFRIFEARKQNERSNRIIEADEAKQTAAVTDELKKEADAAVAQGGDMAKAGELMQAVVAAIQAGDANTALAKAQECLTLLQQKEAAPPNPNPAPAPTPKQEGDKPKPAGDAPVPAEQITQLQESVKRIELERDIERMTRRVTESTLKDYPRSMNRIIESWTDKLKVGVKYDQAKLDTDITGEQKFLQESGIGNQPMIRISESGANTVALAIEGFFRGRDLHDANKNKVRRFHSIREARIKGFGARYDETADQVLGSLVSQHGFDSAARRAEAISSTTFADIWADSMYKVMLDEYRLDLWMQWEKIVKKLRLKDFREHKYVRLGYWGELEDVDPDTGTLQEMPELPDEKVGITATEKGGIFSITRKAIINDDMDAISTLPKRAARAAKLRIYRAVFGLFTANSGAGATIYDGDTLIHEANHANGKTSGGAALSPTAMNACRVRRMRQKAYGSDATTPEYLGELNLPRYILIPPELETMAQTICKAAQMIQLASTSGAYPAGSVLPEGGVVNIHSSTNMDYISVPSWTDADNWYTIADPDLVPGIGVGFLDGNEEPEMFQEAAHTGAHFTAGKVRYAVRHDAGVGVLDYHAIDGQVV